MPVYVSERMRQAQRNLANSHVRLGQSQLARIAAEEKVEVLSLVADAFKSAHNFAHKGEAAMSPSNLPSDVEPADSFKEILSRSSLQETNRAKSEQYVMRRQGGAVERCHTIPHVGSYSNGLHSYNAAQLCLVFHPNPSLDLIKAILDHDVAEFVVGDMPSTMKMMSPAIADELQRVEDQVEERFGLHTYLTLEELRWLKACDLMELYLWTIDQLAMGNNFAAMIHNNILNNGFSPNRIQKTLPTELYIFFTEHNWHQINSLTSLGTNAK